jgi:UDP-2,3-diacylglucosamine pyrophosphatase LpxH
MRFLVVSDCHLGSPSRLPEADEHLIELLESEPWERIVFLGDLFDLWIASFEQIVELHADLVGVIRGLEADVVFVPGNHDAILRGLQRIDTMSVKEQPYFLQSGGRRIALVHGDEYDPIDERFGFFSRILAKLGAALDRAAQLIAGPAFSIQRKIRYSLSSSGKSGDWSDKIAEQATAGVEADVVVAGHTHVPMGPLAISGKLYVNAGDFGPEHETYVVIEDGIVKASWQMDGKGGSGDNGSGSDP